MAIELDDSAWPLVSVRFGSYSDAEWDSYLEATSALTSRRQKYVTLNDATGSQTPNARQRQRAAEVIRRERDKSVLWNIANAVVVESPVLRGVLTAMEWVSPSTVVLRTFTDFDQAREWLATRYQEVTGNALFTS